MPADTAPFLAAALFALSCIAWLPTTHRLGDSVLEFLDHRWDQQQLTSFQKWLSAMTAKPSSRGSRKARQGWKLE